MVINPRMQELSFDTERENLFYKYNTFKKLYEKYSPVAKSVLGFYKCERCGKCCREERVLLGMQELNKLKKFSEKNGENFEICVERDIGKGVYLKLPCPYLIENGNGKEKENECSCKINGIKPNVCINYPFIFLYGYFVSLAFCPCGDKIIKDMYEFNKECGVKVEEKISDNKMSQIVKDIDNMYDKIGMVNNNTSSKILNMPFGYLIEFHRWIKKRKKRRER